jgi:hypothetical protein
MRVEYPGAIYHVMDRGDRREDIVSAAYQVDSSPGANWVFQGRQVGATSLGAWPKQNHRRSSQSMCAARIRIYGLAPFRAHSHRPFRFRRLRVIRCSLAPAGLRSAAAVAEGDR